MSHFILDIETRIPSDEIRVVGVYDCERKIFHTCLTLSGLLGLREMFKEGDIVWTWNGSRFDMPVIQKVWGLDLVAYLQEIGVKHRDGMLLAKMLYPEWDSFSLANVAKKLFPHNHELHKDPVPKDEEEKKAFYNDSPLSDLVDYLEQDLKTTWAVVSNLTTSYPFCHPSASWEHGLKVEQAVAEIVQRQVDIGVSFDKNQAQYLFDALTAKYYECYKLLDEQLPLLPIPEKELNYPPEKQFKKDGNVSVAMQRYCDKYGYTLRFNTTSKHWEAWGEGGLSILTLPLSLPLVTMEKLAPAMNGKIKDYLLDLGWKPTHYNRRKNKETGKWENTSPLLTDPTTKEPCPGLSSLGVTWVSTLADWLQLRSRLGILWNIRGGGWISNCKEELDDKGVSHWTIASEADTCGTPTARFKHRGLVNVPRVTSFMGKEMRGLFKAREGKKMVGWDAEGLEARMEAHYVYDYDKVYARTLVEGNSKDGTDIHTLNWKNLSLPSRDAAKTFKYAITYGARPAKLASSLGVSLSTATVWYDNFWEVNYGLAEFNRELQHEWKELDKKYLIGLDGRLLTTRKEHALLNTKLQGGGAILMKHAMIIADTMIGKKFDREVAHGLIRMHDEEQWEVDSAFADEVGQIGCRSIVLAGEYFKLNVPMAGSYKVGNNWSETH